MRRLLVLLLLVLTVWAAVEVSQKGVEGAFGGVLGGSEQVHEAEAASRRAAGAFQRAYDASEIRVDRMLEDEAEDDPEDPWD